MPTIKDIAAKAGVSHGTVSNVLNKKGNVSAEKIQLVERIAKEMGYKMNAQAQQLRAGMVRKVCVILPKISLKSYNDLYTGLEQYLRDYDFEVEFGCTDNLEYNEERAVKKALSSNPTAIVVVSSLLKNRGLFEPGSRFIFAERKVKNIPEQAVYASFAFDAAGKEMALRCIRDGHKNIAILCENTTYSNNKEFLGGVSDLFEDCGCSYQFFPSDDNMWFNKAFDIINSIEEFDAVIAMSWEYVEYLRMAHQYSQGRKLPAIYALTSKRTGVDRGVIRFEMNYKLLGRTIGKYIAAAEDAGQEEDLASHLLVESDGFYYDPPHIKKRDSTISFLMIQNMTSKAIRMLLPSFTKESGISVNMIEMSYDEQYKMAKACSKSSPYDLIRIDMAWMAELGERIYRPLDEKDPAVKWLKNQMIPTLSENYSVINGTHCAFPLDACIQLLFYRKDLFENELIKREFFEKYKRKLEVPKTFKEFNEVAGFFTKKINPASKIQYGTTALYDRTLLAACDFLPRFREYHQSVFDRDGRVTIMIPEMKEAIRHYIEAYNYTSKENSSWWGDTTKQFSEGKTAMHMVFSNYASEMVHNPDSKIIGRIASQIVPGGQPLSGGGAIGISKHSTKYEECILFLKWLYHKNIAETITYLGGYICNRDLYKNSDIIELYPWLEEMETSFKSGWRIYESDKNSHFNEFLFEDILGKAIRSIVLGIEDLDSALLKAQTECEEAFNRNGKKRE